jgi:aspartate racemase
MMREATSLLSDRNDTATEYPHDRTVSQVFESQAARTPERIAIVDGDRTVTYGELNRRANQLARHLMGLGVHDEMLVGISMYRSIELLVGLLAILKAGGTYVPLDPDYPEARLSFMAEDAGLTLILTQPEFATQLSARATTICVDPHGETFASESDANLAPASHPDGLAYVMYTSGSTGRPKGVEIPHRGIVRLVFGVDYAHYGQEETILHHSPICFDLSTFEVWGALLHGGCCVVYRPRIPTAADLYRQIRQHRVTTLWLTSALYNLIIDENPESLLPIRQLLIGGEALSVSHIRRGLKLLPATQLINGYGPTENTTFSCCYRIPRILPAELATIPIGKPIGNSTAYVVGPDGNLAAPGQPGELYVGGAGLARGYWNRPELTAEKFVRHPFSTNPQDRLYRTGDLARDLPDGTVEFLGRIDFQVKIRGFRVEPGEIEAAFHSHPSVRDVAVVARGPASDKRLAAFVVRHAGVTGGTGVLEEFLRSRLPEHMVPSTITAIDRLPLTPNGKVDHAALVALAVPDSQEDRQRPFVAPRDAVEQQLVALWEALLGRQHIGIRDNFFELGGHSLLAARLFARIEKTFGRELPLAVLFQSATIEDLAAVIRQESKHEQWASIVPIRSQGSKPPLFCVHGVGGNVLTYREVVAHLPPDQPVFGLQSRGLDGKQSIFTRIEDMAAHYIREIKTVQPHGPYSLSGMSFGGVVAFEMAQQLTAAGEVVQILAIFDTMAPQLPASHTNAALAQRTQQEYLARVRFHLESVLVKRERLAYVRKKVRTVRRRLGNRVWYAIYDVYQRLGYPIPAVLQRVTQANLYALSRYTPRVYSGPIDLFAASERAIEIFGDGDLGWHRLTSDRVNLFRVPGDHLTMLSAGNAVALAGLLTKRLELTRAVNR